MTKTSSDRPKVCKWKGEVGEIYTQMENNEEK